MAAADAFAHFPFLPAASLLPGSFFGGNTEDKFMECIWRFQQFQIYTETPITWGSDSAGDSGTVLDLPVGTPVYISSGEQGGVVDPFADEDEILCSWRYTDSDNGEPPESGFPGVYSLKWGPTGRYDTTGFALGGALDSWLNITYNFTGDVPTYLSTKEGEAAPSGGDYTVSTPLTVVFDPDGANSIAALFRDEDSETNEGGNFGGGPIIIKPVLWWPWTVAGNDTWATTTGANLQDPLTLGTNGSPLIFLAQQA